MMEIVLLICELIAAVLGLATFVLLEFISWMRMTKYRWPLAIIGLLFEMVVLGAISFRMVHLFLF